ncbi:hypothetical protein LSTR_LSTR008057 [Laodelphax striatellus]|uniref:Uncharacterized protein n=1 Tax=Laodelphax striatellus TaxID=195883 RepID=A0A482XL53_LAOST|nr:hypothetical protein LSTR_LSTR008057 [Laodelphax striatellus]
MHPKNACVYRQNSCKFEEFNDEYSQWWPKKLRGPRQSSIAGPEITLNWHYFIFQAVVHGCAGPLKNAGPQAPPFSPSYRVATEYFHASTRHLHLVLFYCGRIFTDGFSDEDALYGNLKRLFCHRMIMGFKKITLTWSQNMFSTPMMESLIFLRKGIKVTR